MLKKRAKEGRGIAQSEHDAVQGAVDALLLARCHVLVGKFSSGLFRAAYSLASARNGGALPPFVSLDAPWCADYGVIAGYNDNFPARSRNAPYSEDIVPERLAPAKVEELAAGRAKRERGVELRRTHYNTFSC